MTLPPAKQRDREHLTKFQKTLCVIEVVGIVVCFLGCFLGFHPPLTSLVPFSKRRVALIKNGVRG